MTPIPTEASKMISRKSVPSWLRWSRSKALRPATRTVWLGSALWTAAVTSPTACIDSVEPDGKPIENCTIAAWPSGEVVGASTAETLRTSFTAVVIAGSEEAGTTTRVSRSRPVSGKCFSSAW